MRRGAENELRTRARQQAAVAEFGQRVLAGMELEELLDEAAALVAHEVGIDVVSVLELAPDGQRFVVRGGHGFPREVIGRVLPPEPDTIRAYAVRSGEPVVCEDFDAETRFGPSQVQGEMRVVSAMAAPVVGREGALGALVAHSRSPHHFSEDDANFLQAVANSVGAAVERGRAEALLRDSEARFRELADTTPALMWMTDAEGRVTFVNRPWLRFTGRTLEEERGDTFASSAHPDDRAELHARWREVLARREEFRAEYRLRTAAGGHRWVLEVGVPRYAGGEFLGYVGTATDIHERRSMEQGLRESEARFRELADGAPVMIWTTDAAGRVTFVNQGWLRYTGTELSEELGETWTLGVHPEDAGAVLRSWREALARQTPWEREYRLRRHDGEYRWIVDRGVPRFEEGRLAGYVGTATDIHERKTVEERLRVVYEREHRIAEELQRSVLPKKLPEIEGLELAARYRPAAQGAKVGGDWYDAVELPDGRVALVVGDVVGHGLEAAAVMAQLRTAFRAYSQLESSPAEVVARLNRLLASGDVETMATMLCLVLDRDTGEVTFTSAGHPPALVLSPEGTRFLEGARSVPVGAADPAVFRETQDVLPPGSTLLLYTDGLVERRDVPLDDRLAQLAAAASAAGGELQDLCDQVLSGVLGLRDPSDDVALLAVRPDPIVADHLSLTLPAAPEALGSLRRRLGRFLHAAGAAPDELYEITLTVSEAAANAIEHAYGPGDAVFEVELERDGDVIVASVRDYGSWREQRGDKRGRGLLIIDGLMDSVEVAPEPGGTVVRMRRRLGAGVPA